MDDNRIENAIRPLALERKNYLFCGNDASAYRAAIAYSLIATCKSAEVGPRIWMEAYSACKIFMLVKDRFTKMNASPSYTLRFISLVTMPLNE